MDSAIKESSMTALLPDDSKTEFVAKNLDEFSPVYGRKPLQMDRFFQSNILACWSHSDFFDGLFP